MSSASSPPVNDSTFEVHKGGYSIESFSNLPHPPSINSFNISFDIFNGGVDDLNVWRISWNYEEILNPEALPPLGPISLPPVDDSDDFVGNLIF